jgi:hypothetical protein
VLRKIPGALDPGAPPVFNSPQDVTDWVRGVDWLVGSESAIVLHVNAGGGLTCVAVADGRLQHLGPQGKEALALEALECGAHAVVAVDVRRHVPPAGASATDRRRHFSLRMHLAVRGVVLLDTVIVARDGGASVSGALSYPLGGSLSWLQVHVSTHRVARGTTGWAHDGAAAYPPGSARKRDGIGRPTLWLAADSGLDG